MELIGPNERLSLDDDGRVYLVEPESEETAGRITLLGHVSDDHRCPADRVDEWAALASRWSDELADGAAERALRAAEYDAAIAGGWRIGWR